MKKILVLGKDSYIGESFAKYIASFGDSYVCDILDTVSDEWRDASFKGYDAVYQVAGLAHLKERPEMRDKYFYVNCDLAVECARKAKESGVPLFVYISSASVYGTIVGTIAKDTVPVPTSFYGGSKLQAEQELGKLADDSFQVAILRPPMVYGKGCKGNFQPLMRFARKLPVFPSLRNRRSMIYVDNLSEFVRRLIDNGEGGLYFPQNSEYVCTSEMVRYIAKYTGKKVRFTGLFNGIIPRLKIGVLQKAFGDLYYDFHDDDISIVSFEESIRLSVGDD